MPKIATYRIILSILIMLILFGGELSFGQRRSSRRRNRTETKSSQAPESKTKKVEPSAGQALDELIARVKAAKKIEPNDIDAATKIVSQAGDILPPAELLEKLCLLQEYRSDSFIPSSRKRLSEEKPLDHLILSLQVRKLREVPTEQTRAHPAAEEFPGPVPDDAKRITGKIEIDTSAAGWHNYGIYGNPRSPYWHSTGLYAAPGEVITVTVPQAVTDKGLYVRIGAHNDRLWRKSSWARAPEICRRYAITTTETKAANAFGGLVYIEAPFDLKAGKVGVTITGAVAAPYYVLGKTDSEKWHRSIRNNPAPWGELQGRKVILTLPAKVLRTVDEPEELMKFWDGIMDKYAELLGREKQRRRIERFVSDVQISAGYMHSGYPLMTMLDITTTMVDKERIISNKHHGIWGLFHEIGHNHQNRDWTFRGTTEVTVNLFSLYLMENICDIEGKGHPSITDGARKRNTERHFADGRDFEKWKSSPFLALCMYMQLQEAFGWEPFTKVFEEYRELPQEQRPQDDTAKRDQWMVRFSRRIGKNLGPLFEAWAVPTTEKARASIAELPVWMPKDFPPKND